MNVSLYTIVNSIDFRATLAISIVC